MTTRSVTALSWWRNGLSDRMARAFYHCLRMNRSASVFRFTQPEAIIRTQNMGRDA